jgi:hypothetical protein
VKDLGCDKNKSPDCRQDITYESLLRHVILYAKAHLIAINNILCIIHLGFNKGIGVEQNKIFLRHY